MKKPVIITIKEEQLSQLDEIKSDLIKNNLQVNEVYGYGLIMGMLEEADVQNILSNDAVESVEDDLQAKVNPSRSSD